jgi:hypothetical protein
MIDKKTGSKLGKYGVEKVGSHNGSPSLDGINLYPVKR